MKRLQVNWLMTLKAYTSIDYAYFLKLVNKILVTRHVKNLLDVLIVDKELWRLNSATPVISNRVYMKLLYLHCVSSL